VNMASRMKLGLALLLAIAAPMAVSPGVAGAELRSLTMTEAVDLALKRSPQLRDARSEVRLKEAELEQAHYAQKSEEEKAAGLFAKPKNISQQLQIRMKVPQARMQLEVWREKLRQQALEVRFETESAYLQVYQDMQAEQKARQRWDEAGKALESVQQRLRYGLAKQPDKETAEDALARAASAYKQAQLVAKGSRLAFGEKLGERTELPFAMTFEPLYADLSQNALPGYIAEALKTNIGLIQDMHNRRLADEKLSATRHLYAAKFGAARMKVFDRMYAGQPVDMDLFTAGYESLLDQVRSDWEGYVWIVLPIPKQLFQGEFDGLRYLDDLRNGLPLATMEQQAAELKEKESRSAVITAVRQSYLDAKGAEESYAEALRARDAALEAQEKTESMIRLGLAASEKRTEAREAFEQTEAALLTSQIAYLNAVGKLNAAAGGALVRTYRPGILPYETIDDGLGEAKPPPDKPFSGKWTLKPAVGELLSEFTASPDKKLKATDYALFDSKGKPIAGRTPAGKPVRVLNLHVADPAQVKIVLFAGTETIGEARLEGGSSQGTFRVEAARPAPSAPVGEAESESAAAAVIIGTVKVALDALTPEIYQAASSTVKPSGQGLFYSPDGTAWFGMDRVTGAESLNDPAGKAALSPDEVDALRVTMEVPGKGELKSLLTPDELDQEIAVLAAQIKQLEAEQEAATAGGKLDMLAGLATQLEDAKARSAMLEALKKGETAEALRHMSLVNNPEAIMVKLAAPGAEPGSGGGAEPPSPEMLQAQAGDAKAAMHAAAAAGDKDEALRAMKTLVELLAAAADQSGGISEGLEVLAKAKSAIAADKKSAEAAGETERLESAVRTLSAVEAAARQLEKELLFARIDGLSGLLDEWTAAEQAPDGATADIQAAIAAELGGLTAELLERIKALQIETYTEAELQALGAVAEQIASEPGSRALPLPVQNLISPTIPLKLDVPPVVLDGQAFIPLRAVSESLGAAVEWDGDTQTATVSTEYGTAELTIGSGTAYVNGVPVALDTAPLLIAERTYVPLRLLAEAIGLEVVWNAAAFTIELHE
jgi:outer membrane protein TolC/uncharacterized small protein (DUF1192 family)